MHVPERSEPEWLNLGGAFYRLAPRDEWPTEPPWLHVDPAFRPSPNWGAVSADQYDLPYGHPLRRDEAEDMDTLRARVEQLEAENLELRSQIEATRLHRYEHDGGV